MLAVVGSLVGEDLALAHLADDRVERGAVGGDGAERRRVVLAGQREQPRGRRVRGAEDDEEVGVGREGAIRGGPAPGAARVVDVRRDEEPGRLRGRACRGAGEGEPRVERAAQRGGLRRVDAARAGGRPDRGHGLLLAAALAVLLARLPLLLPLLLRASRSAGVSVGIGSGA